MKFLNVTNHQLTSEQLEDLKGVEIIELNEETKKRWGELTPINYKELVNELKLYISSEFNHLDVIMVAGFMPAVCELVRFLKEEGINVVYSYTKRVSTDKINPDGTVTKVAVFKHQGFYQY